MKNLTPSKQTKYTLFVTLLSVLLILPFSTVADTTEPIKAEAEEKSNLSTEEPQDPMSMPSVNSVLSDYVSIQVDGGTIRQVMNAFALQTKRNVIIGPEVTNNTVTIHLNNVHWDNALEVILKPYGYGYRVVGNAIVVGELNRLQALETVEPLQSRVYELRFLDAGDAKEIIDSQLSPRGKMSIITARGQKGWSFGSPERRAMSRSGSTLQKRERLEEAESAKSKTLIISDVPTALDRIEKVLKKVDRMPRQILVESRFMEVNEDLLRDIGVEMGGDFTIGGNTLGLNEKFYDATPNAFTPLSEGIMGKRTLNTFGQIIGGDINSHWDLLINMIEEDEETKTLSAPKILTLNNQEATIIVGRKYPIIESDVSGGGNSDTISVSLDYYESIGIQLNVVPQICDNDYINMIVHPSVSSIESFVSAGVGNTDPTSANVPLAQYPIIKTRDAETQILVASGETIAIGGLLEERETDGILKVPFLGDIPILGRLFRRDTKDTSTIDLLIFLSATIIDETNYDSIIEALEVEDEIPIEIEVIPMDDVDKAKVPTNDDRVGDLA